MDTDVVTVPVYVAAVSPFTTIVFSEDDYLNATLEEINGGTYDRLKICRTTMTVDGEIDLMREKRMGVPVGYTGAFLFPAMEGLDKQVIIKSVNTVLFQMLLGGIRFDAISPDDIGLGSLYGTGYYRLSGGARGQHYCFLQALQQNAVSSFDAIKLLEPRVFTKDQIIKAIWAGKPIVDKLPEVNPSILLNGITMYKQFQLASSLTFLWSTTEALIDRIWKDKVVPTGAGIPRRKRFIEGNGWQGANKVEVLYQVGKIDEVLYGDLNEVRDARNKLAHRGVEPSLEHCQKAMGSAFTLLSTIASDYKKNDLFSQIVDDLMAEHEPPSRDLKPKAWRKVIPVPGDEKWGDRLYPQFDEIKLQLMVKSDLVKE